MWRYSALRRSITTRCPTSAIRYDDTYDPIPFSRYTPTIAHAMRKTSCCLGSTLSKIGLMRYARPADPTAYTTMPAIAHARRTRYGVAYSNRRCRVVRCLGMASGTPNLKERRKITSPPQGTRRTGGSNLSRARFSPVSPCPPWWRAQFCNASKGALYLSPLLLVSIAGRVRPVPVPGGTHDDLEVGVARRPVQLGVRLLRRRVEHRGIARAPRRQRPRYLASGDAFDGVDDLAHRVRMPGTEIVRARSIRLDQRVQRADVRIGEIGHVDVIAQARAVGRRVIVAEHLQSRPAARRVDGARNHVDFRRVVLPDLALRIGAGRVEIPQRNRVDAVRALEVRQRALHRQLGFPVAVDRRLRMRFRDRRLDRLAVCGAGRREHEGLHRFRCHRFQHAQRAGHVVPVVPRRLTHRLANVEQRRKMHDGEHIVLAKRLADRGHIRDVTFHEVAEGCSTAVACDQVVVDDHAVPGLAQRLRRVTADVAGAAGHEDGATASVQWKSR